MHPTVVGQTPGCGSTRANLPETACSNSTLSLATHPILRTRRPHQASRCLQRRWVVHPQLRGPTGQSKSPHAAAHIKGTYTADHCGRLIARGAYPLGQVTKDLWSRMSDQLLDPCQTFLVAVWLDLGGCTRDRLVHPTGCVNVFSVLLGCRDTWNLLSRGLFRTLI